MYIRKRWVFLRPLVRVKYPQSLRVRLALWNVLIMILTLFLLGGIVYTVVSYNLQASLDRRLLTQGEKLQVATHIWLLTGHPVNGKLFAQLVESMQQDEFTTDDLYIKLFDAKTGKLLQYSSDLQQVHIRYEQRAYDTASLIMIRCKHILPMQGGIKRTLLIADMDLLQIGGIL